MATFLSGAEVVDLLREHGALQQGHFLLSSGMHSSHYIQCALLLQYPDLTARVCAALAEPFRSEEVQAVVGPAIGAVVLAYETARQLRARALWAERSEGRMSLRRSFTLSPGERVLVVEDVVTTGGSAKEVAAVAERAGAVVVGVAAIVDRSSGGHGLRWRFEPLVRLDVEAYLPPLCPLCREGVPLVKPGSR
ncbi:MAG: orotate phosphoribosyltransferase [Armatimonadota bacterium]|nr:orotate phosphoribosyltransferase [Armatimonadota bacterium]MDR5690232.1 orotate phosphoribosyltransferase [Armatimonadota bacterium]MDR7386942.1 orotate phosphoribosyltransferase [Armatimonadota bacterium]MDR7389156.1 orotate phosphoribosyltransferase [Armatimonadota bacterium]MDR7392588.1 orotate phosphoribosyltransferase [Armatimonadota bacterium]